jgi:hypothetical protein
MRRPAFSDSQIFFTAVLGMAAVLLTQFLVIKLVGADVITSGTGAETAAGAPLLARVAKPKTVLLFYAFFVLLPAGLAFLGIGVPFALRTTLAALRGRLTRVELLGLAGIVASGALVALEWYFTTHGLLAIVAAGAVAIWQVWEPLSVAGRRLGFRLAGVAGLALLALAYYENRLLAQGQTSMALAPTALVAAAFFLAAALVLSGVAALRTGARGAAAACWLLAMVWYQAPALAAAATKAGASDRLELGITTAVAAALLLLAALREVRERRDAAA